MTEHPHNKTRRAVDAYHRLIERELLEAQIDSNVVFGKRPMAKSLRPTFLTERLYTKVQDSVYLLRQAILRIAAAHFKDRRVLVEDLGMEEWEIELAAIPTNMIRLSATARMDSFLTRRAFKFVEVNAEVPAGPAYVHHLGRIYRSLEIFQEFEKQFPVRFVSPLEHLLANLVRVYHEEFGGSEEQPTFAIVDFLDIPTYPEFLLLKDYLERPRLRLRDIGSPQSGNVVMAGFTPTGAESTSSTDAC